MENSQSHIDDPIDVLRSKKICDLQTVRENNRKTVLNHNRMLCAEEEVKSDVSRPEMKSFILKLKQKETKFNFQTLKQIKNTCGYPEFIEAFFKINGAYNSLMSCLKSKDAQIQLEAIACFTNLACGPHKLCFRIAKNVGPYLLSFMTGSSHYLQVQCAWTVRNIANDCFECYSRLKSQGVFSVLIKALMSPISEVIESVIFALSACLKHGDLDLIDDREKSYVSFLIKLIEEGSLSTATINEAAFALSCSCYIAVSANSDCKQFDLLKILNCLKINICHETEDYLVAIQLIRCLGYLTLNSSVAESLFNNSLFDEVALKIFDHSLHFLKKEFLWVLTNVSVSGVVDSDHALLLPVIKLLETVLNSLDSAALPALYYICCTSSRNENIYSLYKRNGIVAKIENLSCCGNSALENSAKICLSIVEKDS